MMSEVFIFRKLGEFSRPSMSQRSFTSSRFMGLKSHYGTKVAYSRTISRAVVRPAFRSDRRQGKGSGWALEQYGRAGKKKTPVIAHQSCGFGTPSSRTILACVGSAARLALLKAPALLRRKPTNSTDHDTLIFPLHVQKPTA